MQPKVSRRSPSSQKTCLTADRTSWLSACSRAAACSGVSFRLASRSAASSSDSCAPCSAQGGDLRALKVRNDHLRRPWADIMPYRAPQARGPTSWSEKPQNVMVMRCTGRSSLSTATLLIFSRSSRPLCKRATTCRTTLGLMRLHWHATNLCQRHSWNTSSDMAHNNASSMISSKPLGRGDWSPTW